MIADRVVKAAADGDAQAVKEIGDRLDGRPKLQASVDTQVTLSVTHLGKDVEDV